MNFLPVLAAFLVVAVSSGFGAAARAASQDLLVSSRLTDEVLRFDGDTGALLGPFVTAGSGGLDRPNGLAFGPDGNLYVAGGATNRRVTQYDGATGAPIRPFTGLFASDVLGVLFGPDGYLYVASGSLVWRFDAATGEFVDPFVDLGGVNLVTGMAFGPDGNLYVSSFFENAVLRFDGSTGEPHGVFAQVTLVGTDGNVGAAVFGPDEDLYVGLPNTGNDVLRFDGTTGDELAFIPPEDPHPDGPIGIVFGPDGNLYVASRDTDQVLRYDGASGAFLGVFASGGGLNEPTGLVFFSPPCSDALDNDGDGHTDAPADPGCSSADDASERGTSVCDDGIDQDGDGFADVPDDPGCRTAISTRENPQCQDGLDNDGQTGVDFDGGASVNGGVPIAPVDPQCTAAWRNSEAASACGLGFEAAVILPMLAWLGTWRRSRATARRHGG